MEEFTKERKEIIDQLVENGTRKGFWISATPYGDGCDMYISKTYDGEMRTVRLLKAHMEPLAVFVGDVHMEEDRLDRLNLMLWCSKHNIKLMDLSLDNEWQKSWHG